MITLIPTPIGNIEDITIRAMRLFEQAELFLCEDTRRTKKLLRLLEERFEMRFPQADFYSFHEHNGAQRLEELGERLARQRIVFVSDAGMPSISDPGQLLVAWAQEQGVMYDVLPGASAAVTAYAASGFESGDFRFFGFLPHKGRPRQAALDAVLVCSADAILYEAPHRLGKLLDALVLADPSREIFVAKELTKRHQHYYRGTAKSVREQIPDETIRGEWVLVIRGRESRVQTLTLEQVLRLELPPKPKAKLLSLLSDQSVKEWYERIRS